MNILNKPIKIIAEKNIISDILYDNDIILNKLDKIKVIMKKAGNRINFFMVVLNHNDDTIKGIITFNEIKKIIKKYNKNLNVEKIGDICIPAILYFKNDSIEKALKIFTKTNILFLLIINSDNHYVGKVKRSDIFERIEKYKLENYNEY